MSWRCLTRSYAIANLEDIQPTNAVPAKLQRQTRNPNDTESDDEIVSGTPLRVDPEHGQPTADSKLDETVIPSGGKDAADGVNRAAARKPTVGGRKVVPARSPLPSIATRPVHPGAPDMVKPRRTSTEVTAAAKRKAVLQHQVDELEQKKIDTLAEMVFEEELADEEEERTVVRHQAHADSLDNAEDIVMQSEDEDSIGTSDTEEIFELSTSESEGKSQTLKAKKVIHKPERSQVCSSSNVADVTETEMSYRKKKKCRGET
jgi:hypothetical protein